MLLLQLLLKVLGTIDTVVCIVCVCVYVHVHACVAAAVARYSAGCAAAAFVESPGDKRCS